MADHQAAIVARFGASRRMEPEEELRLARLAANPAPARDAATVVLLRDAPVGSGIEAYLLRRTRAMSFAGGMHVFPGGRVDPSDAAEDLPWVGPSVEEAMPGLDDDPARARALVCAAVRETFEECGVLLAVPTGTSVPASRAAPAGGATPTGRNVPAGRVDAAGGAAGTGDPGTGDPGWAAERRAVESHRSGLAELLTRRGLALRADLLAPWTRWIAPELEPRRYDTRFFVAALPAGQLPGELATELSTEADGMLWIRPAEAMERFVAGEIGMLPPTAFTLAELSAYDDVAGALAAARTRDLKPIMARIVARDGTWQLSFPHLLPPDGAPGTPLDSAPGTPPDGVPGTEPGTPSGTAPAPAAGTRGGVPR
ncbi:NUDIX hydrolase [Parafrankia sp. FMc6]|uniref:NUDIX hydrolase n=1 Tax=Parafrankia soli TaxID=2599596 RepID=UPI0034D3B51B